MSDPSAPVMPPAARPVVELISALGAAAEIAARKAARSTFRAIDRRDGHRRVAVTESNPGGESATPMWNALADQLYLALQRRGAKARLARHLGVPRQRVSDFVKCRRLPDAETTLRMLHWLAEFQAGRDASLVVPPDPNRHPPAQN